MPVRVEIVPFEPSLLDAAAELLAARHAAHRRREPLLDPRYEEPATARAAIEELLAHGEASAWAALRGSRLAGYLVGTQRSVEAWGPNAWVEPAGHAVDEPEIARDLYAAAAAGWLERGSTHHFAIVPAADEGLVDAWFRLCFGLQFELAVRETAGVALSLPDGVRVRRAEEGDLEALARFDQVLPAHAATSPVFSARPLPSLEESLDEWRADLADPAAAGFVAEADGRVVGTALACPVERSGEHSGLARVPGAALLAYAAVDPDARSRGAGRALGEAVLAWAAQRGHAACATDWRATSLLASRAWRGLGFRPTFLRLHRPIV